MNLKHRTIHGFFWSFIDNFINIGIQFIVGIILARLLSPYEFGLIGILTIFIAISQEFINSGFSQALIRKNDCTQVDYSTVFFFNLLVSIIFYFLLFTCSDIIGNFFKEPLLKPLLRVLGLGLILNSFGIIQRVILTKKIDFKLQAKVSLGASIFSSTVAVIMALNGYGVWSLVLLTLTRFGITSFLLWILTKWRPIPRFSNKSFKELFGFGSRLLISGLIESIFQNIYLLVIGKYFSTIELGFYTRADQFKKLPSENIFGIIQRVSYPVLASIQSDVARLKTNYQKLLRGTVFITFTLMLGMAAVAEPLILSLIGEKWLPSVIYLQLLCFVGMLFPLYALNSNLLQVEGRADIILNLQILSKSIAIPTIIAGVIWGIKVMIVGMIINALAGFLFNAYWAGREINYSLREQILDIMPSFVFAVGVNALVFCMNYLIIRSPIVLLVSQLATAIILVVIAGEVTDLKDYKYIKQLVLEKFRELQ